MKRIIVTESQLNEIYELKNLKKIQHKIYKTVSDYCSKMHSDSAWQDVKTLIGIISSVEGVNDIHVGAGEYFNYTNPEKGAYRDYATTVVTAFGNLYGYIRCHAAGTMDDIFKYYDMTISLYPDKEKDMSVNEVMDSNKTNVTFTGSNPNEMGVNAQEKYNDALRSGLKQSAISLNGKSKNNNASDKDETVISFDSSEGNIKDAVTNSVQNAINNGADINKINVQGNVEDVFNGVSEGKVYSKKNIEKARIHEIKKNGKRLTKKQLTEEILNDASIKDRIKSVKNVFKVLDAFSKVYGDEELQNLSTRWDMIDAICEVCQNSSSEQQEQFLDILGV